MHGGLELARPKRRRKWMVLLCAAAAAALVWVGPRIAAALPAGFVHCRDALGDLLIPRYTGRMTELQEQNARLHSRLAQAEDALAENEALRSLLGCDRVEGRWQPARVVARGFNTVTLAGTATMGAAVLDPQGRFAGRITDCGPDTCTAALAGSEEAPCAGLSGAAAGLLEQRSGWVLAGLTADCGLEPGAVVTTPEGHWLGVLEAAPEPEADGLTAWAPLTDTADLNSTLFFVKID